MLACPRCGGESPDGSLHCVHCGARLGEAPHQSTQFGMPQLRPAGPNQKGPQTTQFGAEDLARLAAAAADDSDAPPEPAEPKPVAPAPSLMAGLPRPRVSSAPSPLTEGGRQPVRPAQLKPSARSTVMGMPILADAAPKPSASSDRATLESTPEPVDGPAMLMSLDSFGAEEQAAPPSDDKTVPVAYPESVEISPELTHPVGRALSEDDAPPTVVDSPEVREMARKASEGARQAAAAAPTAVATPAAGEKPGAGGSGPDTEPEVKPARRAAPITEPVELVRKPRTAAEAAARARAAGSDPWADDTAEAGSGMSRGLAALVGGTLIGLVVHPAKQQWFWDAVRTMDGTQKWAFMGAGACGVVALLTAALPIPPKARNALTILVGALGVVGLAMS